MNDAVFARTHALPSGPRVRVRLARLSDQAAVRALLEGRGIAAADLDIRRLLTYEPSTRMVIAASAPIDGAETLVGLGAIDLSEDAEPDTLVVDERLTDGLGELLGSLLRGRARAHARRVA